MGNLSALCNYITTPLNFLTLYTDKSLISDLHKYWKLLISPSPIPGTQRLPVPPDQHLVGSLLSALDSSIGDGKLEETLQIVHTGGKFLREVASYTASEALLLFAAFLFFFFFFC